MHAATMAAVDWWAAPRVDASAWIANYRSSLQARHRSRIVEIVRALQPASVLEIGCHCGPNLIRLAQELPSVYFAGVDANAEAIEAGKGWVTSLDLGDRVELEVGRFPTATSGLSDGCLDVVLCCYTLAYVSPEDLDAALFEVGRLAKRAVILAEPMNGPLVEFSGYAEWQHDYTERTRWIGSLREMTWAEHVVDPPVDRLGMIRVGTRNDPPS